MLKPVHTGTLGAAESLADDLLEHVLSRWEDCEHEKMAALSENDALAADNAKLRLELAAKHQEVA